ncbi:MULTISPECIES: flippase [Elizabethkingia]|uniref:flippase n=1 Tax=Elizabethkingia TaxID=308865 RepID=UPI00063BF3E4|nr:MULTISPECIES: flippase [Elizabethkingia]AKH95618.1 hypothetical protein M876_13680 [Elizabethkingia anophelis FMS-007]MCT3663410.1 flippase [Elizabethkingia anophelis]MCT3673505.1 flippase [Elizabethkingia anophelis]MCT3680922.1 flippase [Elizabethkingia anophelis]MCT3703478.1 flippase [Elizabethkingia anophelis]
MKLYSIKANFFFNAFRVISASLIGIVTMPYINKTLGAVNIGKVEYINTIISYFILFSALGIPMYGIREIARVRDNDYLKNKTVIELLIILTFTSILSYIILFGILYRLDFLSDYKSLIIVMSPMILLSNLSAEWYFQGMENQFYITVRYVIVRIISLFLLFYLIRESSDYVKYAFVLVIITVGSNLFNLFFLFKTINYKSLNFRDIDLKKHYKPVFTIFIAAISINIYLQLDFLMIGTISGDKYVGYYSAANKLIRYAITFITIVGSVLLPRLSNLYHNDIDKYSFLLKKSLNLILIISIPSSILFFFLSKEIIFIMAGSDFNEAILTMKLLSPLCIIVGIAYFIGYLLLYSQGKDKIYTKAVVVSAMFSISVNYFSIKYFQHNGAAMIAVIAELLAIIIMFFLSKKEIKALKIVNINLLKICLASLVMIFVIIYSHYNINNYNELLFVVYVVSIFLLFFLILFILKEDTLVYFKHNMLKK